MSRAFRPSCFIFASSAFLGIASLATALIQRGSSRGAVSLTADQISTLASCIPGHCPADHAQPGLTSDSTGGPGTHERSTWAHCLRRLFRIRSAKTAQTDPCGGRAAPVRRALRSSFEQPLAEPDPHVPSREDWVPKAPLNLCKTFGFAHLLRVSLNFPNCCQFETVWEHVKLLLCGCPFPVRVRTHTGWHRPPHPHRRFLQPQPLWLGHRSRPPALRPLLRVLGTDLWPRQADNDRWLVGEHRSNNVAELTAAWWAIIACLQFCHSHTPHHLVSRSLPTALSRSALPRLLSPLATTR